MPARLRSPELEPGDTLAGYRVEQLLGRGGMGVVYRATQLSLQRLVALKLLAPELCLDVGFRERFGREARLAASLEHPSVLPVYEAGEVEGLLYLALRYIEGQNLDELLEQAGPLEPGRALALVSQVASALDAAHARGLLHRDVKPANVLLEVRAEGEHAYLADFGLARSSASVSRLTATGTFLATVDYVSPEQIRGEPGDHRSDLYALACLVFELLAGRPPFRHQDEVATLWAHMHDQPPALSGLRPELPAALDSVLARALAKQPEERYTSGRELAQALQHALAGERTKLAPAQPLPPAEGLEREFPALKTLAARPNNLPAQPSPLIGRRRELQELQALLGSENVRLLTLSGPGGTGKTRLALQVGAELLERFSAGVYFCPLAPVRDPELLLPAIAETLSLREQPGQTLAETLREYLSEKELLLLLDNLEQLVAGGPRLAELLAACPRLSVLCTSRALLRIGGEHEYALEPLPEDDAVSLFRARAVNSEPPEAVEEICRRLDGLPLAIELAAARTRLLAPTELLGRLEQRLPLLTGGRRDAPERQRTLRATIEWSYELLSPEERGLFARLSVFAGSFTLEAAEEVCEADLDTLEMLLEQSLLRRWASGRLGMLETIREFAGERLEDAQEADSTRKQHAAYFLALATKAEPHLIGPEQAQWLERLEQEHDNFRAALAWAARAGAGELELRLATALAPFWDTRGHLREAVGYLEHAVAGVHARDFPCVRAKALAFLAGSLGRLGDLGSCKTLSQEALSVARECGDVPTVLYCLLNLSVSAADEGDFEAASSALAEAGDLAAQGGYLAELGMAKGNLGNLAIARGDYALAESLCEESAALLRAAGNQWGLSHAVFNTGLARLKQGQAEAAREPFEEALRIARELQAREGFVYCLVALAAVESRLRPERSACLLGALAALQQETGILLQAAERELHGDTEAAVRAKLGDDRWAAAWQEGRALPADQAIVFALGESPAPAV
ncbi:MAG: protein kinase [Actinobacteria bacterium]|nr:protein kinase [Actinomycetota bacterium]